MINFAPFDLPLEYVGDLDEIQDASGDQIVLCSSNAGCVIVTHAKAFVLAVNLHSEAEKLIRDGCDDKYVDADEWVKDAKAWLAKANPGANKNGDRTLAQEVIDDTIEELEALIADLKLKREG